MAYAYAALKRDFIWVKVARARKTSDFRPPSCVDTKQKKKEKEDYSFVSYTRVVRCFFVDVIGIRLVCHLNS